MFFLVSCRNLYADTGLLFRYYGIVEPGYVDTLFLHACGIYLRQFGVIQHHGANGALSGFDVETGSSHLIAEIAHIVY